jgi:hypothetical protein
VVDDRHQRFESPGYVALRGLAVVDVELQPEPVMPDCRDNRGTLLLGAQQIAGRVARVEGLDDKLDTGGQGLVAGLAATCAH